MKRIVRKIGLLCGAMLLAFLLSGCVSDSVEELMTLPQLPIQYTDLSEQIDEMVKKGYEYMSPLTGRNIQSVQMVELNGDGYDEAVAFFRLPSDEKQLKIVVFGRADENYIPLYTIESAGTGIDSVNYCDLTGDGKMELIVGWRISADVQTVAVYSLDEEPTVLMRSGYTRFSIEDLDDEDIPCLLLLRTDKEGNSIAEVYTWRDGAMVASSQCMLSCDMAELSRGSVVSGMLTKDGIPTVLVTGVNSQGMAVTDILTYQESSGLVNVALNGFTGRSNVIASYCQIQPQDIDGDGLIEIPVPAENSKNTNPSGGIISWMNYDEDGDESWAVDTYHSPNADWFFTLPKDWHGRETAVITESTNNENCVLLQVDGEDVVSIYSISGENRETRVSRDGCIVLERQPVEIYAGELMSAAKEYGIDQDALCNRFHLITNFWIS